jgi:hypothetical protein
MLPLTRQASRPGLRTIVCPDPRAPARAEVYGELWAMGTQIADANRRLRTQDNPGDPDFVQNAVLGPPRSRTTCQENDTE